MQNLRILPRLLIAFGVLVLLIAGLSGFVIYSGQSTRTLFEAVDRLKTAEILDAQVEKRVFEGRMRIWMALATDDQTHWQTASEAFKIAHERLTDLIAHTQDAVRMSRAHELEDALAAYEAIAAKLKDFRGKNAALDSGDAKTVVAAALTAGAKVTDIADPLSLEYSKAASSAMAGASEDISTAINISVVVGIISILSGTVLSLLTARSIVVPIRSMTTMMGRLAKRDMTAEIVGRDRKDEVGEMAQAVQTFKESMIEADRLATLQAAENEAKVLRAHRLDDLTMAFEAKVGELVDGVSSAATEMEATAQSMSSIAEETNMQAGAVSAASEQTSANVQTVAVATEELSSSVDEIGRQVTQSARIAGKAVEDARRAATEIQALAADAQKIGNVVTLIQAIAGQTNLLALNATIEAARAGEAGKGFAVVASEVKSLANQTEKATADIAAQITAVQNATTHTVTAIQGITSTIVEINDIAAAIASAVEEQGAATREIARNVQEAARGTQEVASNISGVQEASTATGSAAAEVLSAAGGLSRQSNDLSSEVKQFINGVKAA